MKKQLLLSIFFLGCTFFSFSQEKKDFLKNQTIFGFKAGLNQSYLNTSSDNDYSGLELYGGFFAETSLSNTLSFQYELLYSYTDDISFLEIPLLLKYHLNDKWSIMSGPKLDVVANKTIENALYEPLSVSLEIGTQYNISKRFFIEGRYGYGLSKEVLIDSNSNSYSRNTLRLGVGYKF
ncbi:outer membrane beta-barrel protein [Kordia zhangzhouensis]|uniref:outer membrane beta-barrel protein n=1 Tax=Kordia zhangzhouensis TaxID=1620405 RepID=UPI0012FC5031|nr:outer membrane beta-barrel protein [Kordia zhangzhouensis]